MSQFSFYKKNLCFDRNLLCFVSLYLTRSCLLLVAYIKQISHSKKSATFRFDKSAKNVKIIGPKTEKNGKCWIPVQDIHLIFLNSNL